MKRAFTLLEMMLALAILTLVGVAVSFKMYGVVHSYRFQREVSEVYQALKEAQTIAMTYQIDLTLILYKKQAGFAYRLQANEPLVCIDRKEHLLKEITHISVGEKQRKSLELIVTPSGRIEPCPNMRLAHQKNKQEKGEAFFINLSNPIQVVLTKENPDATQKSRVSSRR